MERVEGRCRRARDRREKHGYEREIYLAALATSIYMCIELQPETFPQSHLTAGIIAVSKTEKAGSSHALSGW